MYRLALATFGLVGLFLFPALALERGEPGCRPEMAAGGPRVIRAALMADEIKLSFVGHSTFLIETPKGITIATDYNDYIRPAQTPRIATMNRAHSTHYTNNPDPGIGQ